MTRIDTFGMGLLMACVLLALLGLVGPQVANITREAIKSIPLNQHAVSQHGKLAIMAKEALENCADSEVRHLDGTGDFKGYELFACNLGDNGVKVAVYVCVMSGECARTVTSYISRNWEYVDNLIKTGKYVPAH